MFNKLIVMMYALQEACATSTSVKNTGGGCDKVLGPVKMIFAAPPGQVIPAGTTDIVAYIKEAIHADASARFYPFFGYARPLWNVVANDSDDVTETSEYTGEIVYIRPGVSNRVYQTTKGGLCYAEQLLSFKNSGYEFFEVDGDGNYALLKNEDLSYSLIPTLNLGGKSPLFATGTTQYKNQFAISFDPTAYIAAKVMEGGRGLLSLKGLEDVNVTEGTGVSSTTKLYVKVITDCGNKDLVDVLGVALADVDNFVVTNHATGAIVTPTGVAIVNGEIELTGTFTSGQTYDVALATAADLYANNIVYYEGKTAASILIP